MSKNGFTFIGGAHDGVQMFAPSGEYSPPRIRLPRPGGCCEDYRREKLHVLESEFIFYVFEYVTTEQAIGMLLEGYRKESSPKKEGRG